MPPRPEPEGVTESLIAMFGRRWGAMPDLDEALSNAMSRRSEIVDHVARYLRALKRHQGI
eukprot:3232963-Rhodomonas_salina.2